VRALDEAATERQCGHVHAFSTEQVQADDSAGHVHDRVHRAHLVEVDLLHARAVHPGLGLGQAREDPRRPRHHRGRELAGAEDREDVAQLAVFVADGGVQDNVSLGGAERAALHLTRLQREAGQPQLIQLGAQGLKRHAGVEQRAQDHVARGAARAVEVDDFHRGDRPLSGSWRPAG